MSSSKARPAARPQASSSARSHDDIRDATASYGGVFGQIQEDTAALGTQASVGDDGRVNVRISQKTKGLADLLVPALRSRLDLLNSHAPILQHKTQQAPGTKPSPGEAPYIADRLRNAPLPLNVVIHVVGSRGDVQPFVALGKVLKADYGHRVRLATHPVFKTFVEEHGLEFFTIGGDPSELMSFMVKNPGLMPGFDTLRNGDVGKRRKGIAEMISGCWRSCIETGNGTGPSAVDLMTDDQISIDPKARPFIADVIIANPPSFAHIHCAEKLGIPLHMMFTMPWSPTQMFPHPLANIQATNADANMTNFISYSLVDMLTWQGLGDVINRFRQKSLGLEPISLQWAPGLLARLKVPWTYCWSPALIPKPQDWSKYINISGFYFLSLADNYTPEPDLKAFLEAGPPPVYIGFGSIVVDDPNAMTQMIFDAVRKTGQRALVSKGWGGFGAEDLGLPDGVFMLGNVPHDWLFKRVSCVVHHGGAGTCAAGIAAGKPTVVCPFFGDQPFWGAMIYRAGAGPMPIPHKKLTSDALAEAIQECLKPEMQQKAKDMANSIAHENGTQAGAQNFHDMLDIESLRCTIAPRRAAVWRIRRTQVRLSAFAATVLIQEGLIESTDIKLYRSMEHEVEEQPWDPMTGGASAIIGTLGTVAMSVADFPVQTLKALRIHPDAVRRRKSNPPAGDDHPDVETSNEATDSETQPQALESQISLQSTESVRSGASTPSESSHKKHGSLGSHRYDVLGALGEGRPSSPGSGSPERSRDNSRTRPRSASIAKEVVQNNFDLEAITDTGKGVYRMVGGISKSPMDFMMGVARGFHNAPKLYGDEVRQTERITDFSSGLRAAGKEFMYGFGDGISGLLTQPIEGARKEGAAGFLKGFGKGIGGIVLKPGAAIWAIPGYTSKGIYMELQKRFGPSVDNYIIASRTAQGLEEAGRATREEVAAVIKHYKELKPYIKRKKNIGEEQIEHIKAKTEEVKQRRRSAGNALATTLSGHRASSPATRTSSHNVPKLVVSHDENEISRTETNDTMLNSPILDDNIDLNPLDHPPAYHNTYHHSDIEMHDNDDTQTAHEDPDLEAAIQRSLKESSRGDPEEDEMVERAIRASVAEIEATQHLRSGKTSGHSDVEHDDEMQQAMRLSIQDAQAGYHTHHTETRMPPQGDAHEDARPTSEQSEQDLDLALKRSMQSFVDESRDREEEDRRDEEAMMRFMMKQSLAEEEIRRARG